MLRLRQEQVETPIAKRSRTNNDDVRNTPSKPLSHPLISTEKEVLANALSALIGMSSSSVDTAVRSTSPPPVEDMNGRHRKRLPSEDRTPPTPSQTYAGADLHAQMMRYGASLFGKDEDGNYVCFFDKCTQRMSNNFSRHIFGHEQRGDKLKEHLRSQEGSRSLCFVDQTFTAQPHSQRKRGSRRIGTSAPSPTLKPSHSTSTSVGTYCPTNTSVKSPSLPAVQGHPLPTFQTTKGVSSQEELLLLLATTAVLGSGNPQHFPLLSKGSAVTAAPKVDVAQLPSASQSAASRPSTSPLQSSPLCSPVVNPATEFDLQGSRTTVPAVEQHQIVEAITAIQIMIRALSSCPVAL